jgi:hypothetical protein
MGNNMILVVMLKAIACAIKLKEKLAGVGHGDITTNIMSLK